jgi:hypothetical protein
MRISAMLVVITVITSAYAEPPQITRTSLPTTDWIQRADLYFSRTTTEPLGWLLLCPGRNGNGEGLLREEKWHAFAKQHKLLMCGVSFDSSRKDDLVGRYTEVHRGSGALVVEACDAYAGRELPFLIVGFSAGARFTTNFIAWKAERVLAWSAQAVGHWPEPSAAVSYRPGIIASGEHDAASWFASLQYFQASRELGKKVIWLSLKNLGHRRSPVLDQFTRDFFSGQLRAEKESTDHWRDIYNKRSLSADDAESNAIFATWLPTQALAELWETIHQP